jgi:hypothetical protein
MEAPMNKMAIVAAFVSLLALGWPPSDSRASDDKLNDATREVESGAKTVGSGIKETAKGVGTTVVEGAKTAGEKLKEAGKAAQPEARTAWDHARDGAVSFGRSVKTFFTSLVGK